MSEPLVVREPYHVSVMKADQQSFPLSDDRPGVVVEVNCDCGQTHPAKITGDEGQMLEWYCPNENTMKRDVNA